MQHRTPVAIEPRKTIFSFLNPAPHVAQLPGDVAAKKYPQLRWQILETTFIGYVTFYLVRNSLPVVSKEMGAVLGYDKAQIGDMLAATAISFGLGKFLLGSISDRSNPRYFMALGLPLTALCNFFCSAAYWAHATRQRLGLSRAALQLGRGVLLNSLSTALGILFLSLTWNLKPRS